MYEATGSLHARNVLALLDQKLAAVDAQLRALRELRRQLVALRAEAAEMMRTEACICGIIERYGQPNG